MAQPFYTDSLINELFLIYYKESKILQSIFIVVLKLKCIQNILTRKFYYIKQCYMPLFSLVNNEQSVIICFYFGVWILLAVFVHNLHQILFLTFILGNFFIILFFELNSLFGNIVNNRYIFDLS